MIGVHSNAPRLMGSARGEAGFATDAGMVAQELSRLGYRLVYEPTMPTTMARAEGLLRVEGSEHPFLVLTDHQTQGVGRDGRAWWDRPGRSLLFSLTYGSRPDLIAILADVIALRTAQALAAGSGIPELQIKYPNDLVILGRKVGGILVKNAPWVGDRYGAIAGIGVNVNYRPEELIDFPTEPGYGATALALHSSADRLDSAHLLLALAGALRYADLDAHVFGTNRALQTELNDAWRRLAALMGRRIVVMKGAVPRIVGRVVDTEVGRGIRVELSSGLARWFNQFETEMSVRVLE